MTHKIILSLTPLLLSLAPAHFAQDLRTTPSSETVRRELVKIGEDDQKHRQEMMDLMNRLAGSDSEKVAKKWKQAVERQNALDGRKRERMAEDGKKHGWPKKRGFGEKGRGEKERLRRRGERRGVSGSTTRRTRLPEKISPSDKRGRNSERSPPVRLGDVGGSNSDSRG